MGGSQKSKRVSWASDVNLCQVRLFLSEECPSQVAMGTQDHLQAKKTLRAGGMGSDDNLPPGFEGIQPANPWAAKLSQISLVKWKCPPRFEVDCSWRVVAGDESREIETQNQREMRVLEAIYPRPSAIPLNPSALVGAEDLTNNDQCTPVVPITPIEDEDASLDTSYATSMVSNRTPMIAHQQHLPHGKFSSQVKATLKPAVGFSLTGMEPDIIAAAQAALSSVMSNSDQGNLIDRELLMKILSDPKMIEQLITSHAASSSGQNAAASSCAQSMPSSSTIHGMPVIGSESVATSSTQNMLPSSLQGITAIGTKNVASSSSPGMPSTSAQYIPNLVSPPQGSFDPVNIAVHRREQPFSARVTRLEMVAPSVSAASGPFHPPSRTGSIPHLRPSVSDVISAPVPSVAAPVTKDINYYKSLIQQHGGERRESMPPQFSHQSNQPEPLNNMMMKPRDSKPKIMKPCIYFNSSRGCRNGANCAFQHDATSQQKVNSIPEVQGTKRVKLDREITGA
ncbi:hypothetical protein C2S52_014162 [Perilla frutescens var. hirtella]|nr:hypothetical protein C2S52_014162 [Perilla frutescens var. hirtella]